VNFRFGDERIPAAEQYGGHAAAAPAIRVTAAHAGAADLVSKKCEGCGLKQPSLGLPAEGRKR
jgi:hypothetical protein